MKEQEILEHRLYNYKSIIEKDNISETDRIWAKEKFYSAIEHMQKERYKVPDDYLIFYERLKK